MNKTILTTQLIFLGLFLSAFFVPIEMHRNEGWYRDIFMFCILGFTLLNFVAAIYHFSVKSELKKFRGLWFFAFLAFNLLTAYIYFIHIYSITETKKPAN